MTDLMTWLLILAGILLESVQVILYDFDLEALFFEEEE